MAHFKVHAALVVLQVLDGDARRCSHRRIFVLTRRPIKLLRVVALAQLRTQVSCVLQLGLFEGGAVELLVTAFESVHLPLIGSGVLQRAGLFVRASTRPNRSFWSALVRGLRLLVLVGLSRLGVERDLLVRMVNRGVFKEIRCYLARNSL